VAGLVWLVEFSPVLALQTLRVDGGNGALDRQVRRSLDLAPGTPLARIDVTAAAARVADRVPTVRTVTVHRRWPSTVTVKVSPRVAVLAMPAGSGWALLDEQAVVVAHRDSAPAGLPVLTDAGDPAAVAGAAAVIAVLPKSLHAKVASITAKTADSITLHTPTGVTVVWGSPEQSARKARVLAALISHRARVYDVSSPDLPTTRQ
jgi:cell division protein FtsQ